MFARVDFVIRKFREIDPTFITNKVLDAHKLNMVHLEKGCLSDHPEINLYIRIKEGDDNTFQELKSAWGSSQLENWHFWSAI